MAVKIVRRRENHYEVDILNKTKLHRANMLELYYDREVEDDMDSSVVVTADAGGEEDMSSEDDDALLDLRFICRS